MSIITTEGKTCVLFIIVERTKSGEELSLLNSIRHVGT